MIDAGAALDRTVLVFQDYVAAPDSQIVETLGSLRIKLVASESTLESPNAQVAVLAAFEAIARLGVEVALEVPRSVPVTLPVPPLRPGSFYEAVERLAAKVIRPLGDPADPCDMAFSFDHMVPADPATLSVGASDFQCRLRVSGDAGGFEGQQPFGAVLAGGCCGAEVARLVVRRLIAAGFDPVDSIPLAARDVTLTIPSFDYPDGGVDLGAVDFVSAGAITHAVLFTLARVPGLRLSGRIFDDDKAGTDNLNRYVLLDADGLELPKEEHLAGLPWPLFDLKPQHGRVGEVGGPEELRARVVVGVDSVEARWAIQRLVPDWVGVGATSHALAMVSQHWPETACAGCVHPTAAPLAERLPTISFVSLIGGALLAYRLVQATVQPIRATEVDYVLDAFRLSSEAPFLSERPLASAQCPVGCPASLREQRAGEDALTG